MSLRAWHYTIGQRWDAIRVDGVIRCATGGVPIGERPCVWFSTRQRWEPTATKGIIDRVTGVRRTATFAEMEDLDGGLIRIGVTPDVALHGFKAYKELSGVPRDTLRALVSTAKERNADPRDWYVSFEPIPRPQWGTVQRWDGEAWVDLDPAEWTTAAAE